MPLVALVVDVGVGGGCFCPGSLLAALEGDGGAGEGLVPLIEVCIGSAGGRFVFGGRRGLLATMAAMMCSKDEGEVEEEFRSVALKRCL